MYSNRRFRPKHPPGPETGNDLSLPHYRAASQRSFLNWLKYDQYRKFMIFKRVHPFFVVTDVSNFFDSVLHSHVAEALHGLPIPTRTVGLLSLIGESLFLSQSFDRSVQPTSTYLSRINQTPCTISIGAQQTPGRKTKS
jgi:hypothetical protein